MHYAEVYMCLGQYFVFNANYPPPPPPKKNNMQTIYSKPYLLKKALHLAAFTKLDKLSDQFNPE